MLAIYQDFSMLARSHLQNPGLVSFSRILHLMNLFLLVLLRFSMLDLILTSVVNLTSSGSICNALRVTRSGNLSHWKGLAYPNTAFGTTHASFLAMRGVTGPLEVFEGNKGLMDAITGPFELDWARENLEVVCRTNVKKY